MTMSYSRRSRRIGTPSGSTLSVLQQREALEPPDGETIRVMIQRAVTDGSARWTRMADILQVLECTTEPRDGTGQKGLDSTGRPRGPYAGSSDAEVALAEEAVEEIDTMLGMALAQGQLSVVPVEQEDDVAAAFVGQEMHWLMNGPMRENIAAVLAEGRRWQTAFGAYVVRLGWRERRRVLVRLLVRAELFGWAAQAGTQDLQMQIAQALQQGAEPTPEEAAALAGAIEDAQAQAEGQVEETIADRTRVEELAAVLQMYDPEMCPGESLRVARAIQAGGDEIEYCAAEMVEARPEWLGLRPGVDVLFPANTARMAEAAWVVEPLCLTASEVRQRASAEGWDEEWTNALLERPGPSFGLWTETAGDWPWLLTGADVGYEIPLERREEYFYPVLFTYQGADRMGNGGIYQCVVHDGVEGFAYHALLTTVDGLMPYRDFRREAHERTLLRSKGVVEKSEATQNLAKGNVDAWYDMISKHVNPPIVKPYSMEAMKVAGLLRPGGEFSEKRTEQNVLRYMQLPPAGNLGLGMEMDKHLRMNLARRLGLRHPEVAPELIQAKWQVGVSEFMGHLSTLLGATYALVQEKGDPEIRRRVTKNPAILAGTSVGGLPPQAQSMARAEIRGTFDFTIHFDTRSLVQEWMETRAKVMDVILRMDATGSIPRTPMLRSLMTMVDPALAMTIKDGSENQLETVRLVQSDVAAIVSGQEPPFIPGSMDHALALQLIQDTVQKSPLMQQYLQNEQVRAVMDNYVKMHQQQVTQEENKVVGQTGGRPVLQASSAGNGA
jgi:hypothetical protein